MLCLLPLYILFWKGISLYFLIITVVTYLLYLHLLDRGDLSLSLTGEESLSVRALPQSAILAQHFPVLKRMMALPSFSIGPASF